MKVKLINEWNLIVYFTLLQALTDIERRFENSFTNQEGKAILLSERDDSNLEITLQGLEDIILYLLDIISSINIFIDIYSNSINKFKDDHFLSKYVQIIIS